MSAENYLTDLEKEKIKTFNQDTVLKNAVYKVLLEPLFLHGVLNNLEGNSDGLLDATKNFALQPAFAMLLQKREMWDFEKMGLVTMANAMAIQFVEQGWGGLEKIKAEPKPLEEEEEVTPQ